MRGQTGGVITDDGAIVGKTRIGDSLDTLIWMADEHRPRCEWAVSPGGERGHPGLTTQKHAEVHLSGTDLHHERTTNYLLANLNSIANRVEPLRDGVRPWLQVQIDRITAKLAE